MNLEQIFKLINTKSHLLKNKAEAKIFLKNQLKILKLKKNKLKLGFVTFEIKEYVYAEIPLYETLDIRYTRQDNTEADELKLENRLKALDWKWDFSNIGAFIIITWCFFYFGSLQVKLFLVNTFPTIFLRETRYDYLVEFGLNHSFSSYSFFKKNYYFKHLLLFFTNLLIDYSFYFKIFF